MSNQKISKQKKEENNVQISESDHVEQIQMEVRINRILESGKIKAIASVNFNKCFAVTNIRLVEGENGFFLAMPSVKMKSGEYKDICFPLNKEFRQELSEKIEQAYILKLQKKEANEEVNSQCAEMQM